MKTLNWLLIGAGLLVTPGVFAQSATVQGVKQDAREVKADARVAKDNIKA